ncbi:MAG: 5'-nucleotidase C-terminal domain-containing protein, partial [Candidatus Nanopelagicales bacterium]|nr:5'-nucleotidase C-terminal domain-containing protein [Candidatus Nanopelagicales bacterium]
MRTHSVVSLSAVVALISTVIVTSPATGVDYAAPSAPTNVNSRVVADGVRVTWSPATGTPPVTHYVVHAGPGSCPITVDAKATSAVMPVVKGQGTITPEVQAINDLGWSADAVSSNSVNVTGKANANFTNIQILQLSDFHGAIEKSSSNIGAAALATAFRGDRMNVKNTLTVSSGDNIGAAPAISTEFEELPTIEALNLMGLDVSTFGNHEHDRNLAHLRKIIQASDFDWVTSNYSTLTPLQQGVNKAKEYVIVDKGGVKVAFVGMNTEQTKDQVYPGNLNFGKKEVVISPKTSTVQKRVDAARAEGADVVIALVHQGWNTNVGDQPIGRLVDVTKALDGVDMVYGGHSHQTYASILDNTPVAMVKNSGQEYSRTQICVNKASGSVVGTATDYVTKAVAKDYVEDPATSSMVASYKSQLSAKLDKKIGVVSAQFPRGGSPAVERSGETPLGNYAADALRAKYGTDLVFINGGGIRDTFPAKGYVPADKSLRRPSTGSTGPYDVTLGDALTVFPFGNSAVTSSISG